ncbi:TetR/AcrR family transcriptional regulator [Spirochaeta cellobiosiphila]|uniref:TetR/AcrR family transcriptional regulator n=1 Tax=Spirochaeta cellobiosiphila TaxID=504483 RepID=UPI0004122F77|nr:TetR/AcrR family transcriptional regulator [Spirochaeta cellobiosiphila]
MPRTGLPSDQLLEKIIMLAEQKIREDGFSHLKLTLLAKELGVSHAALYKHVKNKEDLLDLISMKLLRELDDKLEMVSRQTNDPGECLQQWFETYHTLKLEKVKKDPEIYKTFNMTVEQKKPFIKAHLKELDQQLISVLERCQAQNLYTLFSVEQSAQILMSGTISFHHPRLVVEHKEEDRLPQLKQLLSVLLQGLNQPKGE